MSTLRLITTYQCNRSCSQCCNQQNKSNKPKLISLDETRKYDIINITGGEPLLFPEKVLDLLDLLHDHIVYLYTAILPKDMIYMRSIFDHQAFCGLTFTIHDQKGVEDFLVLKEFFERYQKTHFRPFMDRMRVHIFNDVTPLPPMNLRDWQVKIIQWEDNCPLPQGEDLRELQELWR